MNYQQEFFKLKNNTGKVIRIKANQTKPTRLISSINYIGILISSINSLEPKLENTTISPVNSLKNIHTNQEKWHHFPNNSFKMDVTRFDESIHQLGSLRSTNFSNLQHSRISRNYDRQFLYGWRGDHLVLMDVL